MQEDMHYYGTYAMALAAGIPDEDAETIAYAAQYVDDSTNENSEVNKRDGGLLVGFATAHHIGQSVINQDPTSQRKIWVPCHFIPGGEGKNIEEKCICLPDSKIARQMMSNHISVALSGKKFGLELIGIASHAYMDTFSHYGFSGFSSQFNKINTETLRIWTKDDSEYDRLKKKFELLKKNDANLCLRLPLFYMITSKISEAFSGALGHGGVLSFPDRPYLTWNFDYKVPRPNKETKSERKNYDDYLIACRYLHSFFCEYSKKRYADSQAKKFDEIETFVKEILRIEGDADIRRKGWKRCKLIPKEAKYSAKDWENQKKRFDKNDKSEDGIDTGVYRFHQAAAYHRYYMLKDLLPSYGIAVH